MDAYRIVFKPSAEKDLVKLPRIVLPRVLACLERLKTDPFSKQVVKLKKDDPTYRVRVGDYRIVYGINVKAKVITVHYVRHRRNVYRKF